MRSLWMVAAHCTRQGPTTTRTCLLCWIYSFLFFCCEFKLLQERPSKPTNLNSTYHEAISSLPCRLRKRVRFAMPGTPLKQLKPEDPDAPHDPRALYRDAGNTLLQDGMALEERVPLDGCHDNDGQDTGETPHQRHHDNDTAPDEATPLLPARDSPRLRGNTPHHRGNRRAETGQGYFGLVV